MAVNTNGWMKSALLPQAQWSNSFSDVCQGLLTKGGHKQPVVGCNTFHGVLLLVVQKTPHELLQPTSSRNAFLEQQHHSPSHAACRRCLCLFSPLLPVAPSAVVLFVMCSEPRTTSAARWVANAARA
jgi:hypothetical protein